MKVVPILVGALSADSEAMYGKLLGKYIDDPTNFFSVSSDFCHWGSRYVPHADLQIFPLCSFVQYFCASLSICPFLFTVLGFVLVSSRGRVLMLHCHTFELDQ